MLVADVTFHDDDPAPRVAWLRTHAGALADIPHPGHGRTGDRLRILATIAAADGSLGRLAEGHLDAIAIMTELSAPPGDDRLRGVWAARPELLVARPTSHGWHLAGKKPWCSGADHIDRALVTATDPDGRGAPLRRRCRCAALRRRLAPDGDAGQRLAAPGASRSTWRRSDQIGPPGGYVGRPGFWHGGVGVAACWHGLASRIGRDLGDHAGPPRRAVRPRRRRPGGRRAGRRPEPPRRRRAPDRSPPRRRSGRPSSRPAGARRRRRGRPAPSSTRRSSPRARRPCASTPTTHGRSPTSPCTSASCTTGPTPPRSIPTTLVADVTTGRTAR